jgi:crossover junction endodeoxyribonuclease RuvC
MKTKIILGIDPGLRKTGFGIIEFKNKINYLDSGVIVTAQGSLPARIQTLYNNMLDIIKEYKPTLVSFEKVFININPNSSLLLGQARGALIASAVSKNLNIFEYTALQVKKAVVGKGHANKQQVKLMVKNILNIDSLLSDDSSDALATALCCYFREF